MEESIRHVFDLYLSMVGEERRSYTELWRCGRLVEVSV